MNRRKKLVLALAVVALLALSGAVLAQGGEPAVDWWVLAGGGGSATGAGVTLHDTLGQPVAGGSSGGNVSLAAGYWQEATALELTQATWLPLVLR